MFKNVRFNNYLVNNIVKCSTMVLQHCFNGVTRVIVHFSQSTKYVLNWSLIKIDLRRNRYNFYIASIIIYKNCICYYAWYVKICVWNNTFWDNAFSCHIFVSFRQCFGRLFLIWFCYQFWNKSKHDYWSICILDIQNIKFRLDSIRLEVWI